MKKTIFFLLAIVSLSVGFANSFSANQFSSLKEQALNVKNIQSQLLNRRVKASPLLKSSQANNYLDSVVHTDGSRKIVQYNTNDQVVDYKYFEYNDSEENLRLKEHQTWEYNSNGDLIVHVYSEYDEFDGFIVKEKEEYSYDAEGNEIENIIWEHDGTELAISFRRNYAYSGD
nr:hypothetical protein [Prolixibacteraceae bacterium]